MKKALATIVLSLALAGGCDHDTTQSPGPGDVSPPTMGTSSEPGRLTPFTPSTGGSGGSAGSGGVGGSAGSGGDTGGAGGAGGMLADAGPSDQAPDAGAPEPDASTAPVPSFCPTCNRTQGYYTTHASLWPLASLTLGSCSYSEDQLLGILSASTLGNGLASLSQQVIAAKLNTACGGSEATLALIAQADALIGGLAPPPVGTDFLDPASTTSLTSALDAFNQSNHCQ